MQARRFLVSGRVRGAFRAATVAVARGLGLSGHVPNLDDGRVEVVCAGGGSEIETLSGWLPRGPALACVDAVESQGWDQAVAPEFVTLP